MYIQVTEKCNMTCDHCCFSANGKGSYMTQEVFDKALEIAANFSNDITIGGGEPTLHPQILPWVMQAALASLDTSMDMDGPSVLVVTNGKKKDVALKLAKMAHLGIIQCDLSQDPWHDPISPEVVKEFTRYEEKPNHYGDTQRKRSYAGIRDVSSGVKKKGRAIENGLWRQKGCCCNTMLIAPNGDFYQCGCKKTKLGNILFDPLPYEIFLGECEFDLKIEQVPA
jgi:MoaA/NifB/PqqE/SkfB family radical SAM enzyme